MSKYVIYDNGFKDVHILRLNSEDQGIPVYEHYRHVKEGFSAAQDLVRRLEAGAVEPTRHMYSDECKCSECTARFNRVLADKILGKGKRK